MLVDDGSLRHHDDHWQLASDGLSVKVPPTIQALLAARLDRLDPADRAVAQRGAVVGTGLPAIEPSSSCRRKTSGSGLTGVWSAWCGRS